MKKIKFIVILIFVIFLPNVASSWAISEDKVVSSAEEVVSRWENLFSKDIYLLSYHEDDPVYSVQVVHLVPGSISFDVKKTDSIVTPYKLIVNFAINSKSNSDSPGADHVFGFKNKEDALKHMKEADFRDKTLTRDEQLKVQAYPRKVTCYYAFQKGSWEFKGGDSNFDLWIGWHITKKENFHYFKDLIKIPVK